MSKQKEKIIKFKLIIKGTKSKSKLTKHKPSKLHNFIKSEIKRVKTALKDSKKKGGKKLALKKKIAIKK